MNNTRTPLYAAGLVLVVLIVGLCIYFSAESSKEFKRHCETVLDGRVDSDTQTTHSTGYHMVNGKQQYGSYTSTTTTTYCLSKTGGILEIQ